jgi:hypothetical protein
MKYDFQDVHTNQAGFEQLVEFAMLASNEFFGEVELDFSRCSWFDANMAAPLGVLLARIASDFNQVKITNLQAGVEMILRKNDFLIPYAFPPVNDGYGTVVPYRRFKSDDARLFLEYVRHYTVGKGIPTMTPELLKRFHFSLSELFSNAAQHSESEHGVFAAGQYFPKKSRFDFCVADAGVGFVGAIARVHGVTVESSRAMELCLREGYTTKTAAPGGMGLKLLKAFIAKNGGRIVIVSNSAYYEFERDVERIELLREPFTGTCIDIQIDTSDHKTYGLATRNQSQPPTP